MSRTEPPAAITALTAQTFEAVVAQPGIVVTFWWADWSGPCRKFAAVFEQAAHDHPDLVLTTVDTLAEAGLAATMQVTAVPDLMVHRDGILVYQEAAMLSAEELAGVLRAAREVDMAQVARRLAAAGARAPGT